MRLRANFYKIYSKVESGLEEVGSNALPLLVRFLRLNYD